MTSLLPLRRRVIGVHSYYVGIWGMHKAERTAETGWVTEFPLSGGQIWHVLLDPSDERDRFTPE